MSPTKRSSPTYNKMTEKTDFALITVVPSGELEVYVQSESIYHQLGKHMVKVAPKTVEVKPAQLKLLINSQLRDLETEDTSN